jgi:hypothetical protein
VKPRELSVSISRKLNTGNYESKGIIIGATVSLEENEDLLQVKQELTNKLNQMLDFEIKRIKVEGGRK